MLAILELPDKTAHKGLSCFSSNKVASKQHQRRHQWRPPSRRLARTRDQLLAIDGLRPTTARPPPAGAGVHRLSACARTSPPARSNWRYGEYTLYRSTDYTDYTSPKRHACTRIAAHTAFTAAQTPTNRLHRTSTPGQSDTSPRA